MHSDELEHYGVKGMKWGVRKDRYHSGLDKDLTLRKGSTIQTITKRHAFDPSHLRSGGDLYTAYTEHDRAVYKSYYADYLKSFTGARTVYLNNIKVSKDIKAPSAKKAAELFVKTVRDNPQEMSKSIAKVIKDSSVITLPMAEFRYARKFQKAGEEWLQNKGFKKAVDALISDEDIRFKSAYYRTLLDNGYNALRDIHDISGAYKAEDPLILIEPKSVVGKVNSIELSQKQINASIIDYANKYESGWGRKMTLRSVGVK